MESAMNKLPQDVIVQILLRLMVKSILRFRCVCKAWRNIIKNPDFIAMHFNHPADENEDHVLVKRSLQDRVTILLSIYSYTESLSHVSPDLHIPHFEEDYCIELLGPCNGLVCINNYRIVVLCNPALREFMLVPERPFGCPQDLTVDYVGVGFGFDASTGDYKVVRIVDLNSDYDHLIHYYKAEVYQCSTNMWREIVADLPHVRYSACFELFFNGATHWYGQGEDFPMVLSFCITTEVFQEFDFPSDCPYEDEKRKSLTVLNELLALLSYSDPWSQTERQFIDIWVMKEYGISESWIKLSTIGPLSKLENPITSWNNSAILVERTNGQLSSCAIDRDEITEFDVFSYPTTLRALIYKKSLVSIKK